MMWLWNKLRDPRPVPPYVAVRGPCDLRCAWCNAAGSETIDAQPELERIAPQLEEIARLGKREVGFGISWSEPTTHPALPSAIELARELRFRKITLATSGIRLQDRKYVSLLRSAGLSEVVITFAGLDPSSDALLGRAGATDAKLAAVANCIAEGLELSVILMFARPVLRTIPQAAVRLGELTKGARVNLHGCLMWLRPGLDVEQVRCIWPTFDELSWAMARVRRLIPSFELHTTDMPRCVARAIPGVRISELSSGTSGAPLAKPSELCCGCSRCPGISRSYLDAFPVPLTVEQREPPTWRPEQVDLALRQLRDEPTPGWVHELARKVVAPAELAGYRVHGAVVGSDRLQVEMRSGDDRIELVLRRRGDGAPCFIEGRSHALSYTTATPLDSDARLRAARALLELVDDT